MNYQYSEPDADSLRQHVEIALNNYLQVPSAKELLEAFGDPLLFGGAIRDSIAATQSPLIIKNLPEIQDLDIICGPQTRKAAHRALLEAGYTEIPGGSQLPEAPEFGVIRMEKSQPNGKITKIDIISLFRAFHPKNTGETYTQKNFKEAMVKMVANVDIVACACAYSPTGGILEFIPGAIAQAKNKIIEVRPDNRLHNPDRAAKRIEKLKARGWKTMEIPKKQNDIEPDPEIGF